METLNKNWFAFTFVAVIFAGLGYFYGKQSLTCCAKNKHNQCKITPDAHHSMTIVSEKKKKNGNKNTEIEDEGGERQSK